jgi:putative chitinase
MDRSKFYAALRARSSGVFGTSLSQSQVNGTEQILDEAQRRGTPLRHLSYILSTTYLETGHTMQPIREKGGERYLRSKPYYPWVGEGLVQVTWETNHRKFGATAPGQLMTWPIALKALFDGMTKGMFTGKRLDDYIKGDRCDYVGARRIVNGTDRAADIARYAETFEAALRSANYLGVAPQPRPTIPEPKPDPAPAPEPARGWLSRLLSRLFS